jgi:hypothetical protein
MLTCKHCHKEIKKCVNGDCGFPSCASAGGKTFPHGYVHIHKTPYAHNNNDSGITHHSCALWGTVAEPAETTMTDVKQEYVAKEPEECCKVHGHAKPGDSVMLELSYDAARLIMGLVGGISSPFNTKKGKIVHGVYNTMSAAGITHEAGVYKSNLIQFKDDNKL